MRRLLLLSILGSACATTSFTRAVEYGHSESAKCLVVLVPDIQLKGEGANPFETNGFVEALHRQQLSINIIAADAVRFAESSEYFYGEGSTKHLRDDILRPVRAAQHYEHVWMVGVSAGGYASLRYAAQQPGELDGVVAIEPFLRSPVDTTIMKIVRAGGLATWKPAGTTPQVESLWRWLKERTEAPEQAPLLFFGRSTTRVQLSEPERNYGVSREDLSAFNGDAVLGAALPQYRVFTTEGPHTVVTWKALFDRFLEEGEFKTQCGK